MEFNELFDIEELLSLLEEHADLYMRRIFFQKCIFIVFYQLFETLFLVLILARVCRHGPLDLLQQVHELFSRVRTKILFVQVGRIHLKYGLKNLRVVVIFLPEKSENQIVA